MFDSHAHVAFESFDVDRAEVTARTLSAGVKWLEIGTDITQSGRAVQLAAEHEGVWATVGVHPSDIAELDATGWQRIKELLTMDKVVAVGEVGLDYYRGGAREAQVPVLERFVRLAVERDLPVVFHVRNGTTANAHDDLIQFLREHPTRPHGVIHTFSGTEQQAAQYLDLGLYLSFSGVVTFKNAGAITEVARTVPLNHLLIETDCPFLAPEPYRGKRNEPAYVRYVAERIAALRGAAVSDIEQATHENAERLFGLLGA